MAGTVLAAGLSGACWVELGRCGEDRPCEREGRRRRAGPLRKGAGLLGGFGSGWGSGFHSLLFFKPLKPI